MNLFMILGLGIFGFGAWQKYGGKIGKKPVAASPAPVASSPVQTAASAVQQIPSNANQPTE